MASHTSGPWTVVDGRQIYGPNRDDELLAEVTDTAEGLEGGDGVADANAVLMAAAPDLLKVCEQVLADFGDRLTGKTVTMLRQAIAKAKG